MGSTCRPCHQQKTGCLRQYLAASVLRTSATFALGVGGLSLGAADTAYAQTRLFELEIASGPANQTLTALAEQTKTQLLFPYDQLAGIQTNALDGRYSFRRALRTMLRGTNLRASYDPQGTVVIYVVKPGRADDDSTRERAPHSEPKQQVPQEDRPKREGPENRQKPVEEIFVTSRKRTESIRDVPFSIAAKTEATIFLGGVQDMSDLARGISGMTFTDLGPGQSQLAIRGVSSGQVVRDQPGIKEQVGVYLDETAISMALFTPDLDFFDMKRVEVLRGPQGTLFGSGSLAGTVRYITNTPDLSRFEVATETTLALTEGGDATTDMKAVLNMPLSTGRAAVRAVGYYNELAGYVDSVAPDGTVTNNINDGTKYGGRVALSLEPTDRVSITPRLVYQRLETNGFPRVDLFNVLANEYTQSRAPISLGDNAQFLQLSEGLKDDFLMLDAQIKYDLDWAALTSITSVINRDVIVTRDSGQLTLSILAQPTGFGLPDEILDLEAPLIDATDFSLFSQELRLNSGGGGRLEYVLGGFYTQSDRNFGQTLHTPGFEAATGIPTSVSPSLRDHLFHSRFTFDFSQWALFGEATYELTDRLKVTAGLRWFEFMEKRTLSLDGLFAAADVNETAPAETLSNGLTPRFIVAYEASDTFQINAQAAKGFRLGGINDPLNSPLCTPEDFQTFGNRPFFDDEELWNYEVGFKSTLAGGRLTFDTAVFYADIHNLQATVDAGSCSSRIIFNVPRARSVGIETEVFIRPHPDFDISISATMQNAQIRSTLLSADAEPSALEGIDRGNRLPTSPTFQAATQFSYHWTWADDWSGFAALSLQYVGSSYTQIGDQVSGFGTVDLTVTQIGDPSVDLLHFNPLLPAYQTGSFRIGLRRGSIELSLFINNIWNERIRTSLDRERGGLARIGHMVSRPRTAGLTLRTSF